MRSSSQKRSIRSCGKIDLMKLRKQRSAGPDVALEAGKRWSAQLAHLSLIAHSGNSVYGVKCRGRKTILRLTDPRYRTHDETEAELQFIEHVARHGAKVSRPLPSENGLLIEEVSIDGQRFIASMFEYDPGVVVEVGSKYWNTKFVREWGRSLGVLHEASKSAPPLKRWCWAHEHLIANARHYIPKDDTKSIDEFDRVMDWFSDVSETADTFGMTHSDYAPGNFHFSPSEGITAFDFGNCCYHWFAWDVAVGLRGLHALPESERYADVLLEGYAERFPFDGYLLNNLGWFLRLRYLYFYLDRQMKFHEHPDEQSRTEVDLWRNTLHREIENVRLE